MSSRDELIKKWKPYLHECAEWDGLLVDINDPEFDACSCFNPKPKSAYLELQNELEQAKDKLEYYEQTVCLEEFIEWQAKEPQKAISYKKVGELIRERDQLRLEAESYRVKLVDLVNAYDNASDGYTRAELKPFISQAREALEKK